MNRLGRVTLITAVILLLASVAPASPLSPTLLNDGGFFVDFGESSENSFGVQVPFLTDSLGGDVPANIPNPLMTDYFYDPEPSVQTYQPYVPPTIPTPYTPPSTVPEVPGVSDVPEPSTAALFITALITLGISFRKVSSR